jgi:hypothetical protein
MKILHLLPPSLVILLLSPVPALAAASSAEETGTCKPHTWTSPNSKPSLSPLIPWKKPKPASFAVANLGKAKPGEINCRFPGAAPDIVDKCTCAKMACKYQITVEKFFMLNPELDGECGNIEAGVEYCVAGCKICFPPFKFKIQDQDSRFKIQEEKGS